MTIPTKVRIVAHRGRTAMAVDDQVIPGMSYFTYAHLLARDPRPYFREMIGARRADHFIPPEALTDTTLLYHLTGESS